MTPAAGWRLGACIGVAGLVVASLSGACLIGCGRYRSLACNCHPQRSVSVDGLRKAGAPPGERGVLVRSTTVRGAPVQSRPVATDLDVQARRGS